MIRMLKSRASGVNQLENWNGRVRDRSTPSESNYPLHPARV